MDWDESSWQAIASTALIGTERQPFILPTTTDNLGQFLAQINCPTPEATLLLTAATLSLYQQAGWQPQTEAVSALSPCDRADLPQCSLQATRLLRQMLEGRYPGVLPDWLALAAQAGQRVPELHLPDLLDLGKQRRDLRPAILTVLGQRGNWLAAQNADWSYAVAVATEDEWETGNAAARSYYLQDLRAKHPDRARELLETTWKQDPASDRAKFLDTFYTGLSLADQPFLETALGDRSKEVRQLAADLLASLPDSRLCQQLATHTTPYLTLIPKPSLTLLVELPANLDPSLIQLGIEPKPTRQVNSNLGEKGWWLVQLIGATPLSIWTTEWQMQPCEIVALTQSTDWQNVLLNGFAIAAKRQQNHEWLQAIVQYWLTDQMSHQRVDSMFSLIDHVSMEGLVHALPFDYRDALLIQALRSTPEKVNTSLIIWLLRQNAHQWSLELAQLVLEGLERRFQQQKNSSNTDWELRTAMIEFAKFIPTQLIPTVTKLRSDLSNSSPWRQSIESFLELLQFRQDIEQAFELVNSE